MSDNHADVILVTGDAQLRELVTREKPTEAELRCVAPAEVRDAVLPSAGQYWLDLDSGIAPAARGCYRCVYFCSQFPEDSARPPTGLLVRKPCTPPVIAVLWSGVVPASSRAAPTRSPEERCRASLPDWLLELHQLDLCRFCQTCIETLPRRLGYAEIALYLHDAEQRLLTLAEANSKEQIDLAVPLTPENDHPLAMVACSGEPLLADDFAETCRLRGMRPLPGLSHEPGEAVVIAPLMAHGKLHGVLQLNGRRATGVTQPAPPLDRIFEFLARCLEHAQLHLQARIEARVDRLTGLFNYRWMIEALGKEVRRSQRHGSPLSLIMIDLDGLKSVNDRFGHLGGDALLRHMAGKISAALRQIDAGVRLSRIAYGMPLDAKNSPMGVVDVAGSVVLSYRNLKRTISVSLPAGQVKIETGGSS